MTHRRYFCARSACALRSFVLLTLSLAAFAQTPVVQAVFNSTDNSMNLCPGTLATIMPIPGLCRVKITWMLDRRRISHSRDRETRHNHKASKKASSESVGRKRSGTAPDGAACASAFSLSCMSAWR